jgi:hypothetical protein
MKLSPKEISFARKFMADNEMDAEAILSIMNAKRPAEAKLIAADLISELSRSDREGLSDVPANSGSAVGNPKGEANLEIGLGRLKSLAEAELHETNVKKAVSIASELIETFGPTLIEKLGRKSPRIYTIVSAKTQQVLVEEVLTKISLGWEPLGGVGAAAFGMSPVAGNQYIQAMVKY